MQEWHLVLSKNKTATVRLLLSDMANRHSRLKPNNLLVETLLNYLCRQPPQMLAQSEDGLVEH